MDNYELQRHMQDTKHREKVKELVDQLIDEINTIGCEKLVADAMFDAIVRNHRTLQKGFWRIMFDVADKYKDANYDGRNEAAVKACGKVTEALKDSNLPYV